MKAARKLPCGSSFLPGQLPKLVHGTCVLCTNQGSPPGLQQRLGGTNLPYSVSVRQDGRGQGIFVWPQAKPLFIQDTRKGTLAHRRSLYNAIQRSSWSPSGMEGIFIPHHFSKILHQNTQGTDCTVLCPNKRFG